MQRICKVAPPFVLCKRLWEQTTNQRQKRFVLFRWLPLALVMLQVCVLCTIGLLATTGRNSQKPSSTSNPAMVWLPLE